MKVALLIDTMDFGGSERSVQILANNLVKRKYDIKIFSISNVWVYPLNREVKTYHVYEHNYSFIKKIFLLPLTFIKLKRQVFQFNPEVVISFTSQTNVFNALMSGSKDFKTISSERHYAEDYYGKYNIIAKPIIRWMHNWVDAVIVNDIAILDSLKGYYKVRKPIFILNNLFDNSNISFSNYAKEKDNQVFKFITIGRLTPEKNTKDLIIAFAQLNDRNSLLEIIGDGPLLKYLEKLTIDLGIQEKIIFRGNQKNPFIFLKNADAFVFSSLNEGFPNVILEAMACGLPIISYHFKSGINTILEGGKNGILVKIGNISEMSTAMFEIMNQPSLREYYVQRSAQTIIRFSNKKAYIDQIEKIINKVI